MTCDVTPHHLAMTDAWVAGSRRFAWEEPDSVTERAYDGSCRVNPPLATREDALALLAVALRRQGSRLRLRHASPELVELIEFMGLAEVLRVEPGR